MESDPRPILVTGSPRSGTTWVGRVICASKGAEYLSEPFNPENRSLVDLRINRWFTYVCRDNEADFLTSFDAALSHRPRVMASLRRMRQPSDVVRIARRVAQSARGRSRGGRLLFKDPFAAFSAEWFADRLGAQVVVVVRHPLPVVASLKRLGWTFPLEDLLSQPLFLRDCVHAETLAESLLSEGNLEPLLVNCLCWCLIYDHLREIAARRPDIIVVRHEDLSAHPEEAYEELFDSLGLPLTNDVVHQLRHMTEPSNPAELDIDNPHSTRLHSRANLENWRSRLTASEIASIDAATAEVASAWYSAPPSGA
ncbi:MAG TPA: sulfotransferase [Gaiellaceae bacterium]|nr:sulfotransferase [Gaiellaceae bacterium]